MFRGRHVATTSQVDAAALVIGTAQLTRSIPMKTKTTTILAAFAALFVMGGIMASVEEASAVVCARGVYRAGCVGPHGAAIAHRNTLGHRRVIVR
jgi:hypothetical protein